MFLDRLPEVVVRGRHLLIGQHLRKFNIGYMRIKKKILQVEDQMKKGTKRGSEPSMADFIYENETSFGANAAKRLRKLVDRGLPKNRHGQFGTGISQIQEQILNLEDIIEKGMNKN